ARSYEPSFQVIEVRLVWFGPLPCRRESSATVEVGAVTASFVPRASGSREVAVEGAALRVLLEPRAESRPFAEQRFVRDLDRPVRDGDEARIGQGSHRARRVGIAIEIELGQGRLTTDHLDPLAGRGEAKEDALGCDLPVGIEPAEGLLRQACDRPLDAARSPVL